MGEGLREGYWGVCVCVCQLKGNAMVIFNKNMLKSMSIQIFAIYCFCCIILFKIIKINLSCSPLLVSIFNMRRLARHSNWIEVRSNWLLGTHSIRFFDFNFLLDDFLFFYRKFCLKNLRGAKIEHFSSVISIFFHLDFGLKQRIVISKHPS